MCKNEGEIKPKTLEEVKAMKEQIQEPCAICLEHGETVYTTLFEKTLNGNFFPICFGCLSDSKEDERKYGSEEVEIITLNFINQELRRHN